MKQAMGIVALAILAAGCAPKGGPGASIYMVCDRGSRLQIDFAYGAAFVRVNGGEPMRLQSVESASGARFSSGTHELWNKGDNATWTVGRMVPEQCRRVAVPR